MRKFGVSGYLYHSDVLLWDDCGESFWSQIDAKALAGPETGQELEWLDVVDTTFAKFKKDHPKGEVLKGPNPRRDYAGNPYERYGKMDRPGIHPGAKADRRMHQKAVTTGVMVGNAAYCIPHEEIKKVVTPLEIEVGDSTITVTYDEESDTVTVTMSVKEDDSKDSDKKTESEPKQEKLITMRAFWFAWKTFHPDTTVFEVTDEMKKEEKKDNSKDSKEDSKEDEEDF